MKFLLAAAITLFYAHSAFSDVGGTGGKLHPLLQWFDDRGQIVEINWRTSVRWIWKTDSAGNPTPSVELWIALPQQIVVDSAEENGEPGIRIMAAPAPTREMGLGQILQIETAHRNVTAKLHAETGQEGLLVTLRTNSTRLMLHESCNRYVSSLKYAKNTPVNGPFFVGASCTREHTDLLVHVRSSEDSTVTGKTLRIPQESIQAEPQTFEILANNQSYKYELALKENVHEPVTARTEPAPQPPAPPPPSPLQFVASVAPAYVSYPRAENDPGFHASAYNIDAGIRLAPRENPKWETELQLPLFSIFPGPFHFPASGIYSLNGNLFPAQFAGGNLRLGPGVTLNEIHLEQRSNASGFLGGPQAELAFRTEKLEFRLGAAPLFGSGRNPFFHSVGVTGSLSYELSRTFFIGKSLNFEARAQYFGIQSDDGTTADLTNTSLGLQVWF